MAYKTIQDFFGESVIEAIREFARKDIPTSDDFEKSVFGYVKDRDLRKKLAHTMYGTRWLYKLGLAALVDGLESAAHVRVQVADYAAICEAVLAYTVLEGINHNRFAGTRWKTEDGKGTGNSLSWPQTRSEQQKLVQNRSFYWLIQVAEEEGIVNTNLARSLHQTRKNRNTVHILELVAKQVKYHRDLAKQAGDTALQAIGATKAWLIKNP